MKKLLFILLVPAGLFCCTPEKQQTPATEPVPEPGFTITNLYDAFGKEQDNLTKDFGFSALITYRGKTILFDAGTNADILKRNVEALGIDLGLVDFAVGSHAHGDHINGFDYLLEVNPEVTIYLPYDFYTGANINFNITGREEAVIDSLPDEMKYFGGNRELDININQSGRFWNASTDFVADSREIEEGIRLIATRSPYLGYASKYPSVEESTSTKEEVAYSGLPELSLSLSIEQGEVILVGCSHSSVQQIIEDTKTYTGNPVHLVYGGYHMLPYGREEIITVARRLKSELGVTRIAPTHCTGHLAFKLLKDIYGEAYVFAGLGEILTIPTQTNAN